MVLDATGTPLTERATAQVGDLGARALRVQEVAAEWIPIPVFWAVALAAALTFFLLAWRICAKTGHHGSLGFLMVVPGANLALLFFLAFSRWPVERELQARRRGRL